MALSHISDQEISQDELKYLKSEGRDYCLCHGMICRDSQGNMKHLPFTLYPSPFPKNLFTAAKEVQKDFQLLVHKVSQDYEFIKNALSWYELYYVIEGDGMIQGSRVKEKTNNNNNNNNNSNSNNYNTEIPVHYICSELFPQKTYFKTI